MPGTVQPLETPYQFGTSIICILQLRRLRQTEMRGRLMSSGGGIRTWAVQSLGLASCTSFHQVLACSPEAGRRAAAASSSSRRGLLWRLRDKQSRLGLFEISPGHELHGLMCMMQAGLWAATQVAMDHPPTVSEQSAPSMTSAFFLKDNNGAKEGAGAARPPAPIHAAPATGTRTRYSHGVHSLRVAQGKKKYFIIMQSVFYPAGRISESPASAHNFPISACPSPSASLKHSRWIPCVWDTPKDDRVLKGSLCISKSVAEFQPTLRYDIKGCEVSRWVEPAPEGSSVVLVLKDLNFQGKTIDLGSQRSWFLRQMELDTAFLRELNVLDYSLLMAFQGLHEDERGLGSSLVFRMARSVQGTPSPEELRAQNRRLLPDAPNALHILDGPEQRYFLGLVDLATVYGLRKRLEHLWKTLRYPGRTFSTVSPTRYARRLCQWVEAHTE
nr:phosphatidylinositol 4-phosphate 5-kinase-like protein 1 [Loxodonta africana]